MLLWLIADDDELEESQRDKALLDAEELKEDDLSLDQDKVELDLDDAPFLDDEDEEEEEIDASEPEEEEEEKEKRDLKALLKDKRVRIGLAGLAVLLLGGVLAILFWPEAKEPPPPPLPEGAQQEQQAEPPAPPPPTEHLVAFKPFWVEHVNDEGYVRLLYFKFSALTENEKLAWELTHKRLVLRDAVFYYLKNKDLRFLSDKTKAEQLKKDMLSVINQYLNVDQVQELLIEEYLVK